MSEKQKPQVLHLHLKGVYFDAIVRGEKTEEYRIASIWRPRIQGRSYGEIQLHRGYPKRGEGGKTLYRRWNGYKSMQLVHPHFGGTPVEVLAIDVTKMIK